MDEIKTLELISITHYDYEIYCQCCYAISKGDIAIKNTEEFFQNKNNLKLIIRQNRPCSCGERVNLRLNYAFEEFDIQ